MEEKHANSNFRDDCSCRKRNDLPSNGPTAKGRAQWANQGGVHRDIDKGLKADDPNEQMQRDADKGIKTRNSGESGYVADQDKPGASAHPPGRPGSEPTTGSAGQTGAPK